MGIEQGGSGSTDVRTYIIAGGAIGPAIQIRDMDPDTAYAEGAGWIQP